MEQSSRSSQDIPSLVPSHNFNAMLQDLSSQMAESRLLRHPSNKSSSTSASLRRRAGGISKTSSAGNSPHGVDRRRTMASDLATRHLSSMQDNLERQSSAYKNTDRCRRGLVSERPTTWHSSSATPGLLPIPPENAYTPTYSYTGDDLMGTYHALGNFAMPALPHRSFYEHQLESETPSTCGRASMVDDVSVTAPSDYRSSIGTGSSISYPAEPIGTPNYVDYQNVPSSHDPMQDLFTFPEFVMPSFSELPISEYTSNHMPDISDFRTTELQFAASEYFGTAAQDVLSRQGSKELLGMGLYDDSPERRGSETLGSATDFLDYQSFLMEQCSQDSIGKGLKLEETWQPPEESSDDENDDDSEEQNDEAEAVAEDDGEAYITNDEEEEIAEDLGFVAAKEPISCPIQDNLSNQTFFFDDQDDYPHDILYDRKMAEFEYKEVQEMPMQSTMWM